MSKKGKRIPFLPAVFLAVAAVPGIAFAAPKGKGMRKKGKLIPRTTQALAERWAPVLGVPMPWILAIVDVESGYDTEMIDTRERAMQRGGAWGLMGITLRTAEKEVLRIQSDRKLMKDGNVKRALSYWTGKGESLWNPDLNVLLGAHYLSRMRKMFGDDFKLSAAAYHQGPGKVKELIAAGKPIPERMPPYGRQYVMTAMEAHRRYL